MSIADSFLSLDRESQVSALSKMNTEQKTRLQTLLTEKKSGADKNIASKRATPVKTETGQLLSDFIREDVPEGTKFAIKTMLQFGEGMHDTIDDIGKLLGAPEYTRESPEPKGLIQKGTRFTGSFFTPGGAEAKAGIVAANALKTPAVMAKAQRVANFIKPIAEQTGKGLAFIGETLSSVPREMLERAIKTPEILDKPFKGASTYRKLGEKAQGAVNWLTKEYGETIQKEIGALKNVDELVDGDVYANIMEGLKKSTKKGRVDTLSPTGKRIVNKIEDQLLDLATDPDMDGLVRADELHGVKKQIDNLVKYGSETIEKLGDSGVKILKDVRRTINNDLRSISPDYATANDQFSKVSKLRENLLTRLKDKPLARNMKSVALAGDDFERNLLKELDLLAPDDLKFMNDLDIATINDAFSELFPGKGGGSGGTQGVANILRAGFGLQTGGVSLPLSSPAIQKQLIKKTAKAKSFLKKAKTPSKRMAPVSLIKSGRLIQEQGEN